ncbi:MAG: helix-turn-helix transcriptional regulator [Saprospiraceae bacterium]|nr:helix-turn-helix transcriptional regulator [Saprospiraceae bacterium]
MRKNRKRIVALRKAKPVGLSQEKLAYIADVDRTYMTGIETGKRKVSVVVLAKS